MTAALIGKASTNALIERIYPLACEFREGIERCDKRNFPKRALDFPRGVCGHVARLLGTYLPDPGLGKSVHVSGVRLDEDFYGDHTHAWVELQGIIVDITADQFTDIHDPVIVTDYSPWHACHTVYRCQQATYRSVSDFKDIHMVNLLDTIYWDVIRTINPAHELLEKREQLTACKTLTPHIGG